VDVVPAHEENVVIGGGRLHSDAKMGDKGMSMGRERGEREREKRER
jgi:hypothetical protein